MTPPCLASAPTTVKVITLLPVACADVATSRGGPPSGWRLNSLVYYLVRGERRADSLIIALPPPTGVCCLDPTSGLKSLTTNAGIAMVISSRVSRYARPRDMVQAVPQTACAGRVVGTPARLDRHGFDELLLVRSSLLKFDPAAFRTDPLPLLVMASLIFLHRCSTPRASHNGRPMATWERTRPIWEHNPTAAGYSTLATRRD